MIHYITAIHEDSFQGLLACACSDLIPVPRKLSFAQDVKSAWLWHLRGYEAAMK